MAEEEIPDDLDEGVEGDGLTEGLEKKKFSGKKIVIAVGAVLLLGIIGAVVFFMMGPSAEEEEAAKAAAEQLELEEAKPTFFDMPEILVNLNSGGRKASYLKVRISLELDEAEDLPLLEERLPRVIDHFQVYLRELRQEDIDGSAGMFRLKEELLRRVNASVAPVQVNDILFRELLVQ
ncbi:MAG: flagellar basal body-associated FliL family protein [Sphingomonadales bacterium]|nr:flagellar basal body-associated FliL family protein [Sphingomonadales bacterium]